MKGGVPLQSMDSGIEEKSAQRQVILHVDMDAFFASVSLLDYPEHRGKPFVVVAGARGVVLSANYEARKFGIRAAMPVTRAQRMAPKAIFIPPDHQRYSEVSEKIMEIFHRYTPKVEPLSLDEAFLDVTGSQRLFGTARQIGQMIRKAIEEEEKITCSVGIAESKFIAKLASGRCKPDGMLEIKSESVLDFLHPLPVSEIWGVGPKTNEVLQNLGLRTVYDLAHTPLATLIRALGEASATSLYELAWARDYRDVVSEEIDKSISAAETFSYDLSDPEEILTELLRLTERATFRLRKSGLRARTVSIKVRFSDFKTITRSKTVEHPVGGVQETFKVAEKLFTALHLERRRIRLVGVSLEGLIPEDGASWQLALDEREIGWREAESAVDRALERFGKGTIRPARLIDSREEIE